MRIFQVNTFFCMVSHGSKCWQDSQVIARYAVQSFGGHPPRGWRFLRASARADEGFGVCPDAVGWRWVKSKLFGTFWGMRTSTLPPLSLKALLFTKILGQGEAMHFVVSERGPSPCKSWLSVRLPWGPCQERWATCFSEDGQSHKEKKNITSTLRLWCLLVVFMHWKA